MAARRADGSPGAEPFARPATEGDLDAVARLQATTMVWSEDYAGSVDVETELDRLRPRVSGYFRGTYHPSHALAERVVMVAECRSAVVGFVAGHASTRMGCQGELQWLFVHPESHRQGIGGALFVAMASWFAERGLTRVIVDAPPSNRFRSFYESHGAVPLDSYWLHWPDISRSA